MDSPKYTWENQNVATYSTSKYTFFKTTTKN